MCDSWTTSARAHAAPHRLSAFVHSRSESARDGSSLALTHAARRYFLKLGYCVVFLHRTKSLQPFEARKRLLL